MMPRASYRLEPRPGGYTVVIPRPCNDCEGSGIVAKTRRHYPTTYDHCATCKGTGSTEARFLLHFTRLHWWWSLGGGATSGLFDSPREAADAIVASFRKPWNHEPAPRSDEDIIAAVTSFESPV